MSRRRDREGLALAAIIALGAALRFSTLGSRSFWLDESYTVELMRKSLGGAVHRWYVHEVTPPLYFVLARGWTSVFGSGEWGLRSLSALLGTLTIPVAWAVTLRLATRRAALIAALLVAVSAIDVWFSQDARAYALVVLLGGLSFLAFLRALEEPSFGRLAAWAAVSALLVLSHYFAPLLVAAEGIWLLGAHPPRRRALLAAAAVPAGVAAALAPVAILQHGRKGRAFDFIQDTSLASRIVQVPANYVAGFQPPAQVAVSVLAFLGVLAAAWLVVRRAGPGERRGALVAATLGGAAILTPMAMALVRPLDFLITRNTAAAFVPLSVAVAIGLGARRAGALGAAGVVWLCGFSVAVDVVTANHSKFDHEDWRTAARALGRAPGRRALVVTPVSGRAVLPIYVRGAKALHGSEALLVEIDVIGLPGLFRRIGQVPRPPRPPSPAPPAGFHLAQRRNAHTFTLIRYRAPRPRRVPTGGLDALTLSMSSNHPPALLLAPGASP